MYTHQSGVHFGASVFFFIVCVFVAAFFQCLNICRILDEMIFTSIRYILSFNEYIYFSKIVFFGSKSTF